MVSMDHPAVPFPATQFPGSIFVSALIDPMVMGIADT